jgi:o-succinylbenzoate synthase
VTERGSGEPAPAATLRDGTIATIHHYVLQLRRPLATGRGPLAHRRGALVCLRDGAGHEGWGEAAPLDGWQGPGPATTSAVLERWLRDSGGIADPEELRDRAADTLGAVPCAWAAIGGAAADLLARRAGARLAAFLRGASPAMGESALLAEGVPTAALLEGESPSAVAGATAAATADGFETLKLKVGNRSLADDLDRVAALREVAPQAALRLDANGAWGAGSPAAIEALARFDPEFIEEPCHGIDDLRRLQARTAVPIAADESLPPLAELHRHLPLGVSAAILKPSALGDPHAVLEAVAALGATGTRAIVGSFLESAVGVAAAAHVAAAAGGAPAGLATSAMMLEDVCEPPPIEGGSVRLPAGSGLGLSPDPTRLDGLRDHDR